MKHGYTHLIIILDASGSMSSIQDDIKGSFNEFLKKQRGEPGKTVFDLFQFNDEVKRPVNSVDLAHFHDDLMARYDCSGCTALNDAVCIAIDTVGREFAEMPESERPEHVLCVIITDGLENASREFSSKDVKARIERQKTAYSWQFLFLAANQDAFASGASFGIDHNSCKNFMANFEGVNTICTQMDFFMVRHFIRSELTFLGVLQAKPSSGIKKSQRKAGLLLSTTWAAVMQMARALKET